MNVKFLADYAEVFNGKTPPRIEHRSKGHPVLKIRDVDENGIFRGSFNSYVDTIFAEKFKAKWVQENDILILNAAHNADYVGSKVYIATESAVLGSLATGEWLIVRASNDVMPQYLYLWITSESIKHAIKDIVKGIHLYPKDVAKIKVNFPPIDKQLDVVQKFKAAQELINLHSDSINKLSSIISDLKRSEFDV